MGYGTPVKPEVHNLTVEAGTTFEDNTIVFDGIAHSCQIQNIGEDSIEIKLNDLTDYITLHAGYTQVFDPGEFHLTTIAFRNANLSGGGTDVDLCVVAGVVAV